MGGSGIPSGERESKKCFYSKCALLSKSSRSPNVWGNPIWHGIGKYVLREEFDFKISL